MTQDSAHLFQSHLKELHDILTHQLKCAGIVAEINTQENLTGISANQKKLLSSCRKFYQKIEDNFKNHVTKQSLYQISVFIEDIISFNNAIEKPIQSSDVLDSWASKTSIAIQLHLNIRDNIERAIDLGNIELIKYVIEQSHVNRETFIQILFNKNLDISYEREPKTPWYQLEHIADTYNKNISKLYSQAQNFIQKKSNPSKKPRWSAVKEFLKIKLTIPTHDELIIFGQRLGYPLHNDGLCNGYIIRWIEATLLKQQPKFFNRMTRIMTLNSLLNEKNTLEQLSKQSEWYDVLWDIKAFYESLFLYQNPKFARAIFSQYVSQDDIHVISLIASCDEIKKIGGIKRSSILRYDEFSKQGLSRTLELLERQIQQSHHQKPVCFLLNCCAKNGLHGINITYHPIESFWQWIDINLKKTHSANTLSELMDTLDKIPSSASFNKKYLGFYSTFSISAILLNENSQTLEQALTEIPIVNIADLLCINQSTLYLASCEGSIKVVQALLKQGANPNLAQTNHTSPLYIAAQNGHIEVVQALLKQDANSNLARTDGATSLFIAAQNGHVEIVKALLKQGVDHPNIARPDGATPLFIAAQNGHIEVVRALLKQGANPNLARIDGATPLFIAVQNNKEEIVEYLLLHGADCDKKFQTTIDSLDKFVDEKANGNAQLQKTMSQFTFEYQQNNPASAKIEVTPEQIACIMGNIKIQQIFINHVHPKRTHTTPDKKRNLPQIFSTHHIQNNNDCFIDNKIPQFKL
ncbi:MAG: ankyrin repeat domain-containing protein [Gammaproteobacteria bacterium]|nr:ankyrin repeat domain-containing protein [Gammaproteobacteria bacterium]